VQLPVPPDRELADLVKAVNRMSRRLEERRQENERLITSLEERVEQKTARSCGPTAWPRWRHRRRVRPRAGQLAQRDPWVQRGGPARAAADHVNRPTWRP